MVKLLKILSFFFFIFSEAFFKHLKFRTMAGIGALHVLTNFTYLKSVRDTEYTVAKVERHNVRKRFVFF